MAKRELFADFITDLREQGIEIADPVEPDRPPEYDHTFQVTAVIYSRARKRGPALAPSLRVLPHQAKVLFGRTGFDDDEYPPAVHATSELTDWIGAGEGIARVPHSLLEDWVGQLVQDEATRARRRKKIDVAT